MVMDLSKLRTDLNRESDGVWVDIGDGSSIKVARIGNPRHSAILRKLSAPYRRQINAGTLPDDVAFRISGEAMASAILLDWKALELDGTTLVYSQQAAKDLLCNQQLKDFRAMVQAAAEDEEAFRQSVIEEAEKNLPNGSPGP